MASNRRTALDIVKHLKGHLPTGDLAKIRMLLESFGTGHDLDRWILLWRHDGQWKCGNGVSPVAPTLEDQSSPDFILLGVHARRKMSLNPVSVIDRAHMDPRPAC